MLNSSFSALKIQLSLLFLNIFFPSKDSQPHFCWCCFWCNMSFYRQFNFISTFAILETEWVQDLQLAGQVLCPFYNPLRVLQRPEFIFGFQLFIYETSRNRLSFYYSVLLSLILWYLLDYCFYFLIWEFFFIF